MPKIDLPFVKSPNLNCSFKNALPNVECIIVLEMCAVRIAHAMKRALKIGNFERKAFPLLHMVDEYLTP